MHKLKLKPTYKVVKDYYTELDTLTQLSLFTEGAVSPSFAALLRHCARQFNWTLAKQFGMRARGAGGRSIRVDGALLDPFKLIHGVWEAKDSDDDLKPKIDFTEEKPWKPTSNPKTTDYLYENLARGWPKNLIT